MIRNSVIRRWVGVLLVPMMIAATALVFQGCGDDDDELCGDSEVVASEALCEQYALDYGCSGYVFNTANGVCTVSGCVDCVEIIDDDDFF